MGAPAGNQFWRLRSKHGRDKIFASPDAMWEAACEYFEWCDQNPWIKKDWVGKDADEVERETQRPYTLQGLCLYLDCNDAYFRQFKSTLKPDESSTDKDYSTVIARIEQVIYTMKFEGAAVGAFNANIIARDLGLRDNADVTSAGNQVGFATATVLIVPPLDDDE